MKRLLSFIVVIFLFATFHAHAGVFTLTNYHSFGPLSVRSQNPLYLQFVADPLESTEILKKNDWLFSFETSLSNLFERRRRLTGYGIDLDMELIRSVLNIDYGLMQNYQVGLEVPFMNFSGGFLDTFIQGYHNLFGFPNAGREKVPNGRFSYLITQDGNPYYQVNRLTFGFSDVILRQKLGLMQETYKRPALTAKMAVKIPTGKPDNGTGSGNADMTLSLMASKSFRRLQTYTQAGLMVLGGHESLDDILNTAAGYFAQAFEFNLNDYLSLVGQISGETSIFKNTGIPELSRPIIDLTLGFSGEVPLKAGPQKIFYQASFTEDPIPSGPSIDFAVHFMAGVKY